MSGADAGKLGAAVAIIAVAAVIYFKTGDAPTGRTEDHYFVCTAEKCGKSFKLTHAEYRAKSANKELVSCPACGSVETVIGYPCAACQAVTVSPGHGQIPPKCSKCGAPMQKPPEEPKG